MPTNIDVQQMTAPTTIKWKIHETIGPGYINPCSAREVLLQPMQIPETKIFHMKFEYEPPKSRWEQIMEEVDG